MNAKRNVANLDLSGCDREPIHIPERIQPHGFLLAYEDGVLRRWSANAPGYLGPLSAGDPLDKILGDPSGLPSAGTDPVFCPSAVNPENKFFCSFHRQGRFSVLEWEPAQGFPDDVPPPSGLDSPFLRLHRASDVESLAETAVREIRRLTGFDRVMVYRFEDDGHGVVIAEDKEDGLEPYIGLHYPASDIPQQARSLYLRNRIRLIVDVNAEPVPMTGEPSAQPLDMSGCALRAVSPVHIQYLKNMRVGASLSVSLIRDGRLWGLIACHHAGPRFLPFRVREACRLIGDLVSSQLAAKEDRSVMSEREAARGHLNALLQRIEGPGGEAAVLGNAAKDILSVVRAGSAALFLDGEWTHYGTPQPGPVLDHLRKELLAEPEASVRSSHTWARDVVPSIDAAPTAAGWLAVALPRFDQGFLAWFRPETLMTVTWAGDPTKPASESGEGLSPRRSFEAWKEIVASTSLPWQRPDFEAAAGVRHALIAKVLSRRAEQLARANDELRAVNKELDAFTYVVSHDLKEPLRGIRYALWNVSRSGPEEGRDAVSLADRLADRMNTMIEALLRYARAGKARLCLSAVDPKDAISDALESLGPRLAETGADVRVPDTMPRVLADRSWLSEIFANLISNAVKYNDEAQKVVEIGYDESDGRVRIFVRDNGIGIPKKHWDRVFEVFQRLHPRDQRGGGVGAGLTIVKRLVELMGGTVQLTSEPGFGSTFVFSLEAGHDA